MEAWLSVPTVTEGHGTRGILNVVAKANGNVPAAVKTLTYKCVNYRTLNLFFFLQEHAKKKIQENISIVTVSASYFFPLQNAFS